MQETHLRLSHFPAFDLRDQPRSPPPGAAVVVITYTNLEEVAGEWFAQHVPTVGGAVLLGFDLEVQPVYRAGQTGRLGQLQFSTLTHAMVVHFDALVPARHGHPSVGCLRKLMQRTDVCLIGMGIGEDIRKVRNAVFACDEYDDGHGPTNVELKRFSVDRGVAISGGLGALAVHFGAGVHKSKKLQMSNWVARPLTEAQVRYAALDAYHGLACYHALRDLPLVVKPLTPAEFRARCWAVFGPIFSARRWVSERRLAKEVPRNLWPADALLESARLAGMAAVTTGAGAGSGGGEGGGKVSVWDGGPGVINVLGEEGEAAAEGHR